MNTIYLGTTLSLAFYLEMIARLLRNITSQLAALEEPEQHRRYIAEQAAMTDERARAQLLDGESLEAVDDEDGRRWIATKERSYYMRSNELRREHERLCTARHLLVNIEQNTVRSRDWQTALQQRVRSNDAEQERIREQSNVIALDTQQKNASTTRPDLYELDFVVHVSEFRAVLEVLTALGVNPHKEG